MWELDYKESWHLRIDAFELWCWRRLLRVPWSARRSNQSILKEVSPGCSLARTDDEAETPVLWPPDVKSWLIGKDPDAGKDWGQEEKGTTKDEMVGWHHRLNGHGFGWTPGVGDGQGGMACHGAWGRKGSDTTERLDWLINSQSIIYYKINQGVIINYKQAGKDWKQEEKGMTEDEMAGWHHRLNGHESG